MLFSLLDYQMVGQATVGVKILLFMHNFASDHVFQKKDFFFALEQVECWNNCVRFNLGIVRALLDRKSQSKK